ncbi:hypothetical protein Tco_0084818 [Tanacetum coccineum]
MAVVTVKGLDKAEIVRILAGQLITVAAMADASSLSIVGLSQPHPLEVGWASHIQASIPQAHMTCDDGVQHNAIVKGIPIPMFVVFFIVSICLLAVQRFTDFTPSFSLGVLEKDEIFFKDLGAV